MNHATPRSSRTLLTLAAAACLTLPAAAFAQTSGSMSTSGGAAGAASHSTHAGTSRHPNGNGDQPKGSKPRSTHMREATPSSGNRRSQGSRRHQKQRANGNGNQPNGSKAQGQTTEQAAPTNTANP